MFPEPYRIKMIEPIRLIPRDQRIAVLEEAKYNLFQIPAGTVFIDLLTDSGTGAMSSEQWAQMMVGDESYAGAKSYFQLRDAVEDLFGFHFVLPTHQGRGAERVLFATEVKAGQIIPSNAHFDTTRANLEWIGARPIDLPSNCANDPNVDCAFKGNMDSSRLEEVLHSLSSNIPFVMLTITNNRAAGQPVSMGNLKKVSEICRSYKKPLIIDACRHAENAYFIKKRDPQYKNHTIAEITQEFFSYTDGMIFSAKKDGLCNIGGFLAVRDEAMLQRINEALILMEGFTTYGGLAGRDLGAMAVGLWEAVQEEYLAHRIGQVEFLGQELQDRGIPVYKPVGGHGVYVDARKFFEQREMGLPGQSLAASLYTEGGIRACDIGSGMFSESEAWNNSGLHLELVRLALPRRTYTESHLHYVADIFSQLKMQKDQIRDLHCIYKPEYLGHFTAKFEPQLPEFSKV
ncbi:MAG: tyrosine phenol-lyase [Acidobacteria bacterium]|nr:MAG: tyrosine phenol-lyase [Acidobacteriota bacterium]